MDKRYFSDKLAKWYLENKRDLPWRTTRNPYKIWLSEVILQQTRVSQGLPYYLRFIKKYPNVRELAAAPEQEVLRLWQGLGYYTRARNLHHCAKVIVARHQGKFPSRYEILLQLPGIGEYTAAAIASITGGERVAVVDGNVFRVLSRIFGIHTAVNSSQGKKEFSLLANDLMGNAHAGVHNQAVMEFGALHCTPKNPACDTCIFKRSCCAFAGNLQAGLPVKVKSKGSRKRYFYYLVVEGENSLMMRKREEQDIWKGLFDFHLIEKNKSVKTEKLLAEEPIKKFIKKSGAVKISKSYKHVLSHQTIFSRFIIVKNGKRFISGQEKHSFYNFSEISELPKPVLVSRFLTDHYLL
jgi:A/G-specific adenine glycosylase